MHLLVLFLIHRVEAIELFAFPLAYWGFLVAQMVKNMPVMQEIWVQSLGWKDILEKGMATHSSILAWKIPWTRNLAGYSPWGHKESDTTQRLPLAYWVNQAFTMAQTTRKQLHIKTWVSLTKILWSYLSNAELAPVGDHGFWFPIAYRGTGPQYIILTFKYIGCKSECRVVAEPWRSSALSRSLLGTPFRSL